MNRAILHVDIDAFYASVEQRDNPGLRNKPVIVGGVSGRSVVATCSYEARKYGVHSAMPVFMARQLCPHGIFLQGDHAKYERVSEDVFHILYKLTDKVEPVSIDEAYLDITECGNDAVDVALRLKSAVRKHTGLTISMGLSYNKFFAKLGSEWNKPDGFKIITKDMIPDILKPLPITRVHGIGKKSASKLNNLGIQTIGDMYSLSEEMMVELFGKNGIELYNRIRGIDDREVNGETIKNKSIGSELTLSEDTNDKQLLRDYLDSFSRELSERLERGGDYAKTITVKYKTVSFQNHTKSKTLRSPTKSRREIYSSACAILDSIQFTEKIRLIGLYAGNLTPVSYRQLCLFEDTDIFDT